jgi:hypothetical protein
MQGDYSRHAFSYAVPAPDPGAGEIMFMILVDQNTVHLRLGAAGATEVWLRCSPSVSELRRLPLG